MQEAPRGRKGHKKGINTRDLAHQSALKVHRARTATPDFCTPYCVTLIVFLVEFLIVFPAAWFIPFDHVKEHLVVHLGLHPLHLLSQLRLHQLHLLTRVRHCVSCICSRAHAHTHTHTQRKGTRETHPACMSGACSRRRCPRYRHSGRHSLSVTSRRRVSPLMAISTPFAVQVYCRRKAGSATVCTITCTESLRKAAVAQGWQH